MSMITAYRTSRGKSCESHLRKVDGQESYEIAEKLEMQIRQFYTGLSIDEKHYLESSIKSTKALLQTDLDANVYQIVSKELEKLEGYYNRYKKRVYNFIEDYRIGGNDVFCTFSTVELADEEIENIDIVIEEAIKNAQRIQKWEEDNHDRVVDLNLRDRQ